MCSEEATGAWVEWRCALAGFLASTPGALDAARERAYASLDWTGPHEPAAGYGGHTAGIGRLRRRWTICSSLMFDLHEGEGDLRVRVAKS